MHIFLLLLQAYLHVQIVDALHSFQYMYFQIVIIYPSWVRHLYLIVSFELNHLPSRHLNILGPFLNALHHSSYNVMFFQNHHAPNYRSGFDIQRTYHNILLEMLLRFLEACQLFWLFSLLFFL